jgi:Flp pilus assembly protein TadD
MYSNANNTAYSARFAPYIIAAAALAVYGFTLHYSFHLDDMPHIVDNPAIKHLSNPAAYLGYFPSRAAVFATFALNYALDGMNATGYHIFNIFLHIACGILAWLFAKELLKGTDIPEETALFAALYFTLHPLQTEAVTYIYQRLASMAALFYIGSAYFYLRSGREGSTSLYAVSLVFAAAGYFSKENALTLPATLLALEFFIIGGDKKSAVRRTAPYAVLWLPAIFALRHSATFVDIDKLKGPAPDITPLQYMAAQPGVILQYLRMSALPYGQCLLHAITPPSICSAGFLLPLTALVALISALAWYMRTNKVALFCLAWFCITLSVESGLVPLQDLMFEHRMYLPMFGLALLFAAIAWKICSALPERFLTGLHILLLCALGVISMARNRVWADEYTLWGDVVKKSPAIPGAYNNLGAAYLSDRRYEEAAALFEKSAAINPAFGDAWANLGYALYHMGRKAEALKALNTALPAADDKDSVLSNIGNIYFADGNAAMALDCYMKALRINPRSSAALSNTAMVFASRGDDKTAQAYYRKALNADPDFYPALKGLAGLYYRAGSIDAADRLMLRAKTVHPGAGQ